MIICTEQIHHVFVFRTYLSFQQFRFCLLIPGFTPTIFILYFEYPHVRAKDTTFSYEFSMLNVVSTTFSTQQLSLRLHKRKMYIAFPSDIYNVRTPIKLPFADKNIKTKIYFERVCKKNTYEIFSYTLKTFQNFNKT